MPTTDYIVANGMMLGEVTNGVMRNYGTDALGSVVSTYSNGALENTYAYKPYGATLAKTGTATDPSFLWNGGSGYRATTLAKAEYYVRNRHFSAKGAIWTSVDPYWPGQLPYQYVLSSPVLQADPSGMSICNITSFFSDADTKKPTCKGKVEGNMFSLMAYKDVSFKCNANCTGGMSNCFLYQRTNWSETLSVDGVSRPAHGSGGWIQDGNVMCPFPPCSMKGDWNTQSWALQGEDAPGFWMSSSDPRQDACNKGQIQFDYMNLVSYPNSVSGLVYSGQFETHCACNEFVAFWRPIEKPPIVWSFNFTVNWIGNGPGAAITFGGDCAGQ
jgi:RHS repeat-associated protein